MTDTNDPTPVEERVARRLAGAWIAEDDWKKYPAALRSDYLTYAREVIALVREEPAVVEPPADRAALRDRIAESLYALMLRNGWDGERTEPVVREMDLVLDAVLAVLPEPTNRAALRQHIADTIRAAACPGDCGQTEEECARQRIQPGAWHHGVLVEVEGRPELFADAVLAALPEPADRAAVLREAVAIAESLRQFEPATGARKAAQVSENVGILRVADELRRMADEAQPETPSMKLARASVQAMTDTLQRPTEKPTQPRTDDPDHRHAAALHFLGKPIPTGDQDGDRP